MTANTARNHFRTLNQIFKRALAGGTIEANPCPGVEKERASARKKVPFSEDEIGEIDRNLLSHRIEAESQSSQGLAYHDIIGLVYRSS